MHVMLSTVVHVVFVSWILWFLLWRATGRRLWPFP